MSTGAYADIAARLARTLELEIPPVALARANAAPDGIDVLDSEVPSSCSLWREAESRVFYAPAARHFNCPVGAMTMGFELTDAVKGRLMDVVQQMCACGYIGQDEPASMPTVPAGHTGMLYGPLRDFPAAPDLVVMWLAPRQAMLFNEASGAVRWSGGGQLPVLGRPACSALPMALSQSRAMLSMGCLGMRTFTDISADRMLAVLPAAELERFAASLDAVAAANSDMAHVYDAQKAAFTTGG